MKKNKRITKYPKDKNSTTPGEDSSEEQINEHKEIVQIRNQQNSELTRIKKRLLIPYLKNMPYCMKKMEGQEWVSIKAAAMKAALIDFSQEQQKMVERKLKKKISYYSLINDIPQAIRSSFITFICNLLAYSEEQLFNSNENEVMEHKHRPENQNLKAKAEQLIKEVEQILVKDKVGDPFNIQNGICTIEMEDENMQRESNKSSVNKALFIFLLVGILCISQCCEETSLSSSRMLFDEISNVYSKLNRFDGGFVKSNDIQRQSGTVSINHIRKDRPEFFKNITNTTEPSNLIFDSGTISSNMFVVFLFLIVSFLVISICVLALSLSLRKAKCQFFRRKQDHSQVYV